MNTADEPASASVDLATTVNLKLTLLYWRVGKRIREDLLPNSATTGCRAYRAVALSTGAAALTPELARA